MRFIITLVGFIALLAPASADADGALSIDNFTCEEVAASLQQASSEPIQVEDMYPVMESASQAIILGCPTSPSDRPIQLLERLIDPVVGYLGALELGAVYEFGLRTRIDPGNARRWYLRHILTNINANDAEWDKARMRIAQFHPASRNRTSSAVPMASLEKKMASPLFEHELSRIQGLRNGRVEGLVGAIEDFADGSDRNRQDVILAGQALRHIAEDGHPKAMHVLALGILDHRFVPWNKSAGSIRAQAQHYLIKAAAKKYVPSLLKLAELCEGSTVSTAETAIAFYQIAAREGAQVAEGNLRRLHAKYPDADSRWIDQATQYIKSGKLPPCP